MRINFAFFTSRNNEPLVSILMPKTDRLTRDQLRALITQLEQVHKGMGDTP